MDKVNIDFGSKYDEAAVPVSYEKIEVRSYPSFFIDSDKELDIPESGRMVIEFTRRSKTESIDSEGKERCSYNIDVEKIVGIETDREISAPTKNYGKKTEDILDALRSKLSDKTKDSGEGEGY